MHNRLAGETSPYLRQHADQPVAWQPWDQEALEAARTLDRPILLSIGYAACHWCHVMAHESFADPAVAALMNRLYVNLKVDREERPDLDRIHQLAHQALTGRPGGWPLTVFLDPRDLTPFFAGTYFPRHPRYGMPAFTEVLERVAAYFREHRGEVRRQGVVLRRALAQAESPGGGPPPAGGAGALDEGPIRRARDRLLTGLDPAHGGWGPGPKFPMAPRLAFLLERAARGDGEARHGLERTLTAMADGGLRDHLAGGFFRYCVDGRWEIPHFEKMLYDNAQLLGLYARAWRLTGEPLYREVAAETAGWMLAELAMPEGGLAASLDADSELAGRVVEGGHYLWTREEVEEALGEEAPLFLRRFGLDGPPNFEGRWHLAVRAGLARLEEETGLARPALLARLEEARRRLAARRARRPRPARDGKRLTAWNALAAEALATAGRLLGEPAWVAAAEEILAFLRRALWREGRLLASHHEGRSRHAGLLEDHAFLLEALLAQLRARWRPEALAWARALAAQLLERFQAPGGGFFQTPSDHEPLLIRPRPLADDALPSGNGAAARALLRLGRLLGEPRWVEAAERTLQAARPALEAHPEEHPGLLLALEELLHPPRLAVLRAPEEDLEPLAVRLREREGPGLLAFAVPLGQPLPGPLGQLPEATGPILLLCEAGRCLPPLAGTELEAFLAGDEAAVAGLSRPT
ncbi:MAG: thioredoxin domain-containing protein, partial [Gammaproteobacteria bacterium]